jgi:hypothetical protein
MNDIVLFGVEIPGNVFLGSLFVWLIATAANLKLFAKCDQPAWAVFVPGYNVVVAMRIIGRPDWHAAFFLVPGFNVYFAFRTMMELGIVRPPLHGGLPPRGAVQRLLCPQPRAELRGGVRRPGVRYTEGCARIERFRRPRRVGTRLIAAYDAPRIQSAG